MSLQSSDSITLRINRHSEITCFLDTLTFFFGSYGRFQEAGRGLWGGWNWVGAAWLGYFLRGGQGWPQPPSGFTSAQLGLGQSWSSCPAAAAAEGESGWQAFCLMLMKAGAGQEGGGAAFVLHLS